MTSASPTSPAPAPSPPVLAPPAAARPASRRSAALLWGLDEGDSCVGRGWFVGYDFRIADQPGTGAVTRVLRLTGGGSVEARFDASAAAGPYYPLGATAATAAMSLAEETSARAGTRPRAPRTAR